jgi:hypothetical protein
MVCTATAETTGGGLETLLLLLLLLLLSSFLDAAVAAPALAAAAAVAGGGAAEAGGWGAELRSRMGPMGAWAVRFPLVNRNLAARPWARSKPHSPGAKVYTSPLSASPLDSPTDEDGPEEEDEEAMAARAAAYSEMEA